MLSDQDRDRAFLCSIGIAADEPPGQRDILTLEDQENIRKAVEDMEELRRRFFARSVRYFAQRVGRHLTGEIDGRG